MMRGFKQSARREGRRRRLHRLWLQCSRRHADPRSLRARHDSDLDGGRTVG
jgi:hypothetical protein